MILRAYLDHIVDARTVDLRADFSLPSRSRKLFEGRVPPRKTTRDLAFVRGDAKRGHKSLAFWHKSQAMRGTFLVGFLADPGWNEDPKNQQAPERDKGRREPMDSIFGWRHSRPSESRQRRVCSAAEYSKEICETVRSSSAGAPPPIHTTKATVATPIPAYCQTQVTMFRVSHNRFRIRSLALLSA